jgi:Effector-associated domain 11
MKKNKNAKNSPNTEGRQIINNHAPIHQQFNIQTLNGNISDLTRTETDAFTASITHIKQAIAKSETDKAFKLLMVWLKENHPDKLDDAVVIQGRWEYLKKEKYKGVIDGEVHNRETNRIHDSIIIFMAQFVTTQ